MNSDGSIKIDVKLINDKFIQDLVYMQSSVKTAAAQIEAAAESAKQKLKQLEDTQKSLTEKIETQKAKIQELAASVEKAKTAYANSAAAADGYKNKLEGANAALFKANSAVTDCAAALQRQKGILESSESSVKMLSENYQNLKKRLGETADETKTAKDAWEHSKKVVEENKNAVAYLTLEYNMLSDEQKAAAAEQRAVSAELAGGEKAMRAADAEVERLTEQYNKSQQTLAALETGLEQANGAMSAQKEQVAELTSEWAKSIVKLQDFAEAAQEMGERLKEAGENMERVGDKLTYGISEPLFKAAKASVNAAVEFESAFAGIRKTVDATEAEYAQMEKEIKSMAKTIPASAKEIAGIGEMAGQLGIKKENIVAFSRTIIDLGNSTNLAGEAAASTLAKFANITKMPQTEFSRLGSTLVALGNNLATTEADIANMAMRLAGAGKQAGMTEAQILSFSGALASVGIEAEAGGTAFSKVFKDIQLSVETGNSKLKDFAKVAGMSADEFSARFKTDAAGAIMAFVEGLSDTERMGASAIQILADMGINEVRMSDALLRSSAAADMFNEAIGIGTTAWEENTALTNEAEQRYATMESRLIMLKESINLLAIEFGETLMPYVEKGVKWVGDLVEKFSGMDAGTRDLIVHVGAFAAIAGPLLIGFGKFASAAGSIASGIGNIAAEAAKAKAGVEGASLLGQAFAALPSLINPVTTAIGLVGAAIGVGAIVWGAYKKPWKNTVKRLFTRRTLWTALKIG